MKPETQFATQEQKGLGNLALPLLVVGGLFLFAQQRGGGNGGGGGGVGNDVPAGMANVGGGISGVTVSQGGAPMGQLEKTAGQSVSVLVRVLATTTRAGQSIEWPYYIIVRIGHSTTFGWRTAGSGGVPSFGGITFPWPSTQRNVAQIVSIALPIMKAPDDPGVTWDVHVQLRAQESDEAGNPNGVWMNLGSEFKEDGAIRTVSASNPALVGGTISRVGVGQVLPGRQEPKPGSRRGLRLTGRR